MEQGITQKQNRQWMEIYSDFEVRFESSLEASQLFLQQKAVHQLFVTLECGVIP